MIANPDFLNEFEVPPGAQLRVPFPLNRVWQVLGVAGEI
jgi:hypothetical protein